jgi:hypothetical protein
MAVAIAAGGALACVHLGGKPYPLYPNPEVARAPAELATLQGPIARVDGAEVSPHGKTFTLLPGCHVVALQNAIGAGGEGGAWSAHLPPMTYAFRMKAAHSYVIEVLMQDSSGPVGSLEIKAVDRGPSGSARQVPLENSADIETCRRWSPGGPDDD